VLLIVGIVLLFALDSPWNWIALLGAIVLEFGELAFWHRTVRRRRVEAGAETLIGMKARVVTPCRPLGQVAVAGELWQARCEAGAGTDQTVRVVDREQLLLIVEPEPAES
jgi:membrane-bound ClpP family serine protease